MKKLKSVVLWMASIICAILTLTGLFSMPSSAGLLSFIIPAILLNPIFRKLAAKKKTNLAKPVTILTVIAPFIITIIFACVFPTQTKKDNTVVPGTSSAVTYAASSAESSSSANSSSSSAAQSSSQTADAGTAPSVSASNSKLKVHYLDVGQGDSEFLELPNGQTMLIDAGVSERGAGIVSYINGLGYSKIDYIICTHPHADHIGGMAEVVNSFAVGKIYMPRTSSSDTPTTKVYKNLLSAIQNKGLSINTAKFGVTVVDTGSLSIKMIAPKGSNYGDLNQYSAVLMLQYGNNKFLFMGDAGNVSENEITADVKADVIKVGHHGSKTSTGASFIKKVSPKYAVIEVGKGNSYGHPTAQCLSRLQSVGANVYRTDECGTIIFTSDGNVITINKKASSIKENAPNQSAKGNNKTNDKTTAAAGTAAAAGKSTTQGQTVYITDTGKCYHTSGCNYLKKSKHAISLKDAKSRGYKPCSKCNPPE